MGTREKGQDRIRKICDTLKYDTIEPAKQEAEKIIAEAHTKAAEIIHEAGQQVERLHAIARADIELERNVFKSSLLQASKQCLESLRQNIETSLFNDELVSILKKELSKPEVIADLIRAVIGAIDKDGLKCNLEVFIPKHVSAGDINRLIGDHIIKRLQKGSVSLGQFDGGIQVKLVDRKMTVDISDSTIKELVSGFIRKDFRKMLFGL